MTTRLAGRLALIVAVWASPWRADAINKALIDKEPDGSRSSPVHLVDLFDEDGVKISADDLRPLPFSSRQTCGECHRYETVSKGWHFNAASTDTVAGRRGEPWILADEHTGTQLPLSYRDWPGTWLPDDVGLTPWRFTLAFGSHLPGGGVAETGGAEFDPESRWHLSGPMEINCLACHNAERRQDGNEWSTQIARQNLRWAATAASGLAIVKGNVARLPDSYSLYDGPSASDPAIARPTVRYDASRFDAHNNVFFDVLGKPTADRCYFCHSTKLAGPDAPQTWETDEDVHLAAGLTCVDCHRHGLDHDMARGYRSEASERYRAAVATLSCEGCHLGGADPDSAALLAPPETLPGRLAAPTPEHEDLPIVHFEKMTCTACHSGPWPQEQTRAVRTSRAHNLGVHGPGEAPQLPAIVTPVFMKQGDGKIAPHNMMWPSFWAYEHEKGDLIPLLPDEVWRLAGDVLRGRDNGTTGTERILTPWKVGKALAALQEADEARRPTVYVSGERTYRLSDEGDLRAFAEPAEASRPYAWPIAHNVRPAGRALGVRACEDCHAKDAPFYFGEVASVSPMKNADVVTHVMLGLQEKEGEIYVRTSQFFKWLIIITMTLLILHILGDLFRRAMRRRAERAP